MWRKKDLTDFPYSSLFFFLSRFSSPSPAGADCIAPTFFCFSFLLFLVGSLTLASETRALERRRRREEGGTTESKEKESDGTGEPVKWQSVPV